MRTSSINGSSEALILGFNGWYSVVLYTGQPHNGYLINRTLVAKVLETQSLEQALAVARTSVGL